MAHDDVARPTAGQTEDYMKCTHCGAELAENEIATNAQTARVHGINFGYCHLCWDAWGTMTYGWQAGVPADKRVSFTDRAQAWEARGR